MGKVKTLSICLSSFNFQWIPIYRNGSLQTGLFELPVMLDPPSSDIRQVGEIPLLYFLLQLF